MASGGLVDSHITWVSTASSGKYLGMECLQKLLSDKYESGIRWRGRRMCIHLLLRELQNYNLVAEQPPTGECWIAP